jgi:hypothetical protein
MKSKIGRNDPCPCGSGKKAKNCHGTEGPQTEQGQAVPIVWQTVVQWFEKEHGRAFGESYPEFVVRELWPEEAPAPADYPESVEAMLTPFLIDLWLSCGEIRLGRRYHRPCELAANGLAGRLPLEMFDELILIGDTPLRLYRVVGRTESGTWQLVDALDLARQPLEVPDVEPLEPFEGMLVGVRVAELPEGARLVGQVFAFPVEEEIQAMNAARETAEENYETEVDRGWNVELEIGAQWLAVMLEAMDERVGEEAPRDVDEDAEEGEDFEDTGFGDSSDDFLFVTDHYELLDEPGLRELLDGNPQFFKGGDSAWLLEEDNELGLEEAAIEIRKADKPGRLELNYPSLDDADTGQVWFEEFAGESVRYLTREISSPDGMLDEDIMRELEALPPEALNELLSAGLAEQTLRSWLDEPCAELGGATPRAVAAGPGGAERVRPLLLALEEAAAALAAMQGQAAPDTAMLWDELGVER